MTTELPKNFDESLRYDYPLTPDSLVIDCGFYKGEFALEMARRYNCWIEAYEPIPEWWRDGLRLTNNLPKVRLSNFGIGACFEINNMRVKGGLTGKFNGEGDYAPVTFVTPDAIISPRGCDVLKLNIEGSEFEVLEFMLQKNMQAGCKNIQVQFHDVVPNAKERHASIRSKLLETHHLTYDFPWCWENYRRNE